MAVKQMGRVIVAGPGGRLSTRRGIMLYKSA
jgi:hypothetical protein